MFDNFMFNRGNSGLEIKTQAECYHKLHALSLTQQGRQREPSFKPLFSPLSAEFWRHCVLSGITQGRKCYQFKILT